MTHRNDDKHTALGGSGQTDDLELDLHSGPQDNDGWLAYFQANGATSNNYNDAAYEFLIAQGVTAGALPDMWAEFWAGGGPTPPVEVDYEVDLASTLDYEVDLAATVTYQAAL